MKKSQLIKIIKEQIFKLQEQNLDSCQYCQEAVDELSSLQQQQMQEMCNNGITFDFGEGECCDCDFEEIPEECPEGTTLNPETLYCEEEEEIEPFVSPCDKVNGLPKYEYYKFCDKCETDDTSPPWMGGPQAQFDESYCECCRSKGPDPIKPKLKEQLSQDDNVTGQVSGSVELFACVDCQPQSIGYYNLEDIDNLYQYSNTPNLSIALGEYFTQNLDGYGYQNGSQNCANYQSPPYPPNYGIYFGVNSFPHPACNMDEWEEEEEEEEEDSCNVPNIADFPFTTSQGGFNTVEEFCNRCEVGYDATNNWAAQNDLPHCDCCSQIEPPILPLLPIKDPQIARMQKLAKIPQK